MRPRDEDDVQEREKASLMLQIDQAQSPMRRGRDICVSGDRGITIILSSLKIVTLPLWLWIKFIDYQTSFEQRDRR